jgi:hypothetical protein
VSLADLKAQLSACIQTARESKELLGPGRNKIKSW